MVIHDLDDLEYPPFRKPPYEDGIFFGTSGGRLLPRESGFGHPLMAVCSYRLEEESRMMVGWSEPTYIYTYIYNINIYIHDYIIYYYYNIIYISKLPCMAHVCWWNPSLLLPLILGSPLRLAADIPWKLPSLGSSQKQQVSHKIPTT